MDAAKVRRDEDLGALIIEVLKPISYREILDLVREELEPNPTRHLIWNVHPGTAGQLTTDDFKDFYTKQRSKILTRRDGITIYVAPGDAENALCRWAQVYVEKVADVPISIHVVRSFEEAQQILTEANTLSPSSS